MRLADYQRTRRDTYPLIATLLISFVCCFSPTGSSQTSAPETDQYGRWTNGITEPWSFRSDAYLQAEATAARTQWKAIGAQIDNEHDEWAGDYRSGDLHGNFLRWAPKAGFVVMSVFTCEANVTNVEYGSVSASPSFIEFHPYSRSIKQQRAAKEHSHGPGSLSITRYIPIKWGPNHYLVPENQVAAFGEYLAGLGRFGGGRNQEYVELDYYWKLDDSSAALTGLPIFPPSYQQFIRKPITAMITSVGRSYVHVDPDDEWWDDLLVPVNINVGKTSGVRRGMELYVVGSDENETVEVSQVGLHSSKGLIRRFARKRPGVKVDEWDNGKSISWPTVKIGLQVTSSSHLAIQPSDSNK